MIRSRQNNSDPVLEIKRILVPTDFSDSSQSALAFAKGMSKVHQSKIYLFHVIETSVYSLDTSLMPPGDPFGLRQKLVEMIEEGVKRLKEEGFEAEGECVVGMPTFEIIQAVQKKKCDLIVMGTHGRTGLAHILLGSTAERVIQRASCPVITVKAEKKRVEAEEKEERGSLEEKRRFVQEMIPPGKRVTYCHLCGKPAQDIICDPCKIRVQTEAFDMKQRVEKEGRVDTGRR